MKSRSLPPIRPDVRALLDTERVVPALPDSVRARAVARGRAALAAGRVTPPEGFTAVSRMRWGVVLAAAVVASTAVGATAYEVGAHRRIGALHDVVGMGHPSTHMVPVVTVASTPSTSAPAVAMKPFSSPISRNRAADAGQDELLLLRKARAAVARRDFAAALVSIGEHELRFNGGRLVEEREALRVKALSGLGRTGEARRAAHAFEARFPRSVLLSAVNRMLASEP